MGKLKQNIILNFIYQLVAMCFPLVTTPYLSRVVGAEGIGVYAYFFSVAHYFVLFAMLGLSNYGVREISLQKDENLKNSTFCNIYFIQMITATISAVCYIMYVLLWSDSVSWSALFGLYVLSAFFDVTWFYFGKEMYKPVLIRNLIFRLITLILIFSFVRDEKDIICYSFIMMIGILIPQISLWCRCIVLFRSYKVRIRQAVKEHFIPNCKLFLPVVAVSVYKYMDKIMLGNMTLKTELGYYENVEKLVNIPVAFVTALGTVMLARATKLYSNGAREKGLREIKTSVVFTVFLSSPMIFGIAAIMKEFVPLYFGKDFFPCVNLAYIMVPTVLFIGVSNVIRTQYLIPRGKDNIFVISVVIGAIVNFSLNYFLIRVYSALGAAIATLFAEISVCAYQMLCIKKDISLKGEFFIGSGYILCGIIMFFGVSNVEVLNSLLWTILLKIFIGCIIYLLLSGTWTIITNKEIRHWLNEKIRRE